MKKKQQGMTLIVVLILLIAITAIGSLAIRSSTTQLRIATAGQVQQLMLQNTDAALFQVEHPDDLARHMALNGLFGFIKAEDDSGKELVFCYRAGDTDFFSLNRASLIRWDGNSVNNSGLSALGFCRMQSGYFSTSRQTVMTQVAVKAADLSNIEAFQHMQTGTDVDSTKADPGQLYTVVATTIFPDFGTKVDDTKINNCFSNHFNAIPETRADAIRGSLGSDPTEEEKELVRLATLTVSRCLSDLGVPTHTQVATYSLMQTFGK